MTIAAGWPSLRRRLGRRMLADVATIVAPDTILRWHRELAVRTWTYAARRPGRPSVQREIQCLVVRMATGNQSWGYTRIRGALKNLGRPTTWRTFPRAHWPALLAADFLYD